MENMEPTDAERNDLVDAVVRALSKATNEWSFQLGMTTLATRHMFYHVFESGRVVVSNRYGNGRIEVRGGVRVVEAYRAAVAAQRSSLSVGAAIADLGEPGQTAEHAGLREPDQAATPDRRVNPTAATVGVAILWLVACVVLALSVVGVVAMCGWVR